MTTTSDGRRYKIHHVLGQGGFGTVYAAELLGEGGFSRKVALKVLNPDMQEIEDVANRLRDEARLLGILRHRAIVQVDGLVKLNGRWTVVMEFIEGADLQRVVRSTGPIPLGCALEIVSEVSSALDIAYATPGPNGVPLKIIHRDIKPPNILLTAAAETKVLDFGIARADFAEREAQTKSVLFGSIGYMAPERMEFQELPAGDVFALGVVLFEMIDGNALGKTSINPAKHTGHVDAAVARLLKKIGPYPPEFPELLRSMLAYDPDDRPTAREVERRCRSLRGSIGEPWLRDWAEHIVPPLLKQTAPATNDAFSGQIVVEGGTAVRLDVPAPPTSPQPFPSAPDPTRPVPPAIDVIESPDVRRGPSKSGAIARRKVRRPSFLWTLFQVTAIFGCVTSIGVLVIVAIAGIGTVGAGAVAFLAVLGLASGSNTPTYDPGPSTYGTYAVPTPEVVPEVSGEEYKGPFGFTAAVTEPWKSLGMPIGRSACIFSDAKSITIYHPLAGNNAQDMGGTYAAKLVNGGWTQQYDYTYDTMRSMTFTKGSENLSLSSMIYEDNILVTMAKY